MNIKSEIDEFELRNIALAPQFFSLFFFSKLPPANIVGPSNYQQFINSITENPTKLIAMRIKYTNPFGVFNNMQWFWQDANGERSAFTISPILHKGVDEKNTNSIWLSLKEKNIILNGQLGVVQYRVEPQSRVYITIEHKQLDKTELLELKKAAK